MNVQNDITLKGGIATLERSHRLPRYKIYVYIYVYTYININEYLYIYIYIIYLHIYIYIQNIEISRSVEFPCHVHSFGDRGGNPHHNATARHLYLSTSPLQAAYRALFPKSNICQKVTSLTSIQNIRYVYIYIYI